MADDELIGDLRTLEVDATTIWELERGEHLDSGHWARNAMRKVERECGYKFRTVQYKNKVYVVRVA